MSQNLISATLPEGEAREVQQLLTTVKTKLSFLVSLEPSDVPGLFKAGNALSPLIDKAYNVVQQHPEILAGVFDKEEFNRDYELYQAIKPIIMQINELAETLNKTVMAVGSDLMISTLDVYSAVKQNKDRVPGLNATYQEMAVFFKKSKAKKNPEA